MIKQASLGYYKSECGNVGDDLNYYLWPKLLSNINFRETESTVIIGVGSILDSRFDDFEKKIVIGAGARGIESTPYIDESWDIMFVRGPKTASALKKFINVEYITDPAILVSEFFSKTNTDDKVGFVPYFLSNHEVWRSIADQCGFKFISPRSDLETFVKELSECKFVITESMHGAIIADALRIPWYPISSYTNYHEGDTHDFKWGDWLESMQINASEIKLPIIWDKESSKFKLLVKQKIIAHKLKKIGFLDCFLSDDVVFKEKIEQLKDVINKLNLK